MPICGQNKLEGIVYTSLLHIMSHARASCSARHCKLSCFLCDGRSMPWRSVINVINFMKVRVCGNLWHGQRITMTQLRRTQEFYLWKFVFDSRQFMIWCVTSLALWLLSYWNLLKVFLRHRNYFWFHFCFIAYAVYSSVDMQCLQCWPAENDQHD